MSEDQIPLHSSWLRDHVIPNCIGLLMLLVQESSPRADAEVGNRLSLNVNLQAAPRRQARQLPSGVFRSQRWSRRVLSARLQNADSDALIDCGRICCRSDDRDSTGAPKPTMRDNAEQKT